MGLLVYIRFVLQGALFFFFFLQTHVPAQIHLRHSDKLLSVYSPVRPTPAVLSQMFVSASTSTSWWDWTWRGTVSASDWGSVVLWTRDWGCRVLQAQGNERQALFCHKGPKGREDPDQDTSLCSDILLWHLRLWKGIVFYHLSVLAAVMHRNDITTGWHCNLNVGMCRHKASFCCPSGKLIESELFFFCRWMQNNITAS